MLIEHKYDTINGDMEYKYLRTMPIDSVIEENRIRLLHERDQCKHHLRIVKRTTPEEMWLKELNELRCRIYTI